MLNKKGPKEVKLSGWCGSFRLENCVRPTIKEWAPGTPLPKNPQLRQLPYVGREVVSIL